MNSKIFSFILCLFCSSCLTYPLRAQSLKGRIIDENQDALSYINVAVYQTKDSALIAGAISDEHGIFHINDIPQGNYRLRISAVGYQPHPMELQVSNKKSINLGDITLKQDNVTLNEIIIKAKQNPLSVNKGKYVLHVNKSELKKQATVFDVLSFLPGVLSSANLRHRKRYSANYIERT
jgi:iron complex outermembrane receptor protein